MIGDPKDVSIPTPISNGTTDHPEGPNQPPETPAGLSDTPPQNQTPEGLSDTPPVQNVEKKSIPFGQDDPTGETEAAVGMAKSVGQTVSTLGHLANKFVGSDKIENGLKVLDRAAQIDPNSVGEHAGALLEGISEFVLGDEALKALSFGEKLGIAQKITDIGMKYPFVAKILGHGIQSIRQGVVAGGQSLLHGASPEDAAITGLSAAALGTGVGVAAEGAGSLVRSVTGKTNALNQAAARTPQEIQPAFQQGIKDMADQVAKENGVPTAKSASIRDYIKETASNVEDKARDLYQKIDAATGENFFQRIEQKLANTKRAIRDLTGTEEDVAKEAKLEKSRTELMEVSDEMWKKAEAKGVTRADYDEAVDTWKQAQALHDISIDLNKPNVTSGARPDVVTAAQALKDPETVHPSNFFTKIDKRFGDGRLQEAFGDQRASNLYRHVNEARTTHASLVADIADAKAKVASKEQTIKKLKTRALGAAGIGAAGAAGAGLYDLIKK